MNLSLSFAPYLPFWVLGILGLLAALTMAPNIWGRLSMAWVRLLAAFLFLTALANPVFNQEERKTLTSIAAILVDQSASQKLGERDSQTKTTTQLLKDRLEKFDNLEIRIIETKGSQSSADEGTALFSAIPNSLSDVPKDRIAGIFMISDGQIHDVPSDVRELGIAAPIHALITGTETERDRRIYLASAPRFGLVGKLQTVMIRIEDSSQSGRPTTPSVPVEIWRDGRLIDLLQLPIGETVPVTVEVEHAGLNLFQFKLPAVNNELTTVNNTALLQIEGIRENLRVLLVSGKPHPGERTWRNLLKSDPSVDLVHFTILRPPSKQDATPINELSLIAFPTRELFLERIDEFDLIIFDRYERLGVLSTLYFENIQDYVLRGGAILFAMGPEYAGATTLYSSALNSILPAEPSGKIYEQPFYAQVNDLGKRHPITRDLPGADQNPPAWSRWFRLIDVIPSAFQGNVQTIMSDEEDHPLLMLARHGEGRISLLLSDHAWLWARGFEGGGPHLMLLRRLGHWLMQVPELEEERLFATAKDGLLTITRQSITLNEDDALELKIKSPHGGNSKIELQRQKPGLWQAQLAVTETGLYELNDDDLKTMVQVGPDNPVEYQEVLSTEERLSPLIGSTGGLIARTGDTPSARSLPRIVPIRAGAVRSGTDWMGIELNGASRLIGITQIALFAGLLGLAILLSLVSFIWYREGR